MALVMSKKESIEWVAVEEIVLGTNPRTVKPSKDRVAEYARSIALYGILVPLIADKKADGYHLQAGYTRLAAVAALKADKALTALAQLNNVDLDRVPVRIYQGDEKGRLMLPIIENNFHDVMNEVDVAESSPTSCTVTMFGWERMPAACASRRNRSWNSFCSTSSSLTARMVFSATRRPMTGSRPR